MENVPKDPVMLMSFVNMKMRDEFSSLDDLCHFYALDKGRLTAELEAAGFSWMPGIRQFR